MIDKNLVVFVQARLASTRLPNKVMRKVAGTPLIEFLLRRISKCKNIGGIVLVTSVHEENNLLADFVRRLGFTVFRGSETDVLDRFYQASLIYRPDAIVRITGDCPIIDPEVVDLVIDRYFASGAEYVSNVCPPTWPDGQDVEIFSFELLETAWENARTPSEREHVTQYMQCQPNIERDNVKNDRDLSAERWTVDFPEDLELIQTIMRHFHPDLDFGWKDVIELKVKYPELFLVNQHIKRNIGVTMSDGSKLWERAKRVIPGGNMLLSKRPEMFLPDRWPTYFSKSRGCEVWDLEGNHFVDMSLMGVGTNILGYGDPEVDEAVKKTIDNGNGSTLNCPEEVYLAERLVALHPWSDMVRFARTGGEANAIAVRIARAASGKDKVAVCGYHGWHDWYLSANLPNSENLASHLLPGLEPNGVPKDLQGSVLPFRYNDLSQIESLIKDNEDIGVITMEVVRNQEPMDGFLEGVRKLATDNGIVLVFDECTSGFRQNFGGIHKLYDINPDIATFGKALGNGYAITAILGRKEVMEAAQSTFISSTFWTERIGSVAALKTLEVMEKTRSWEVITATGEKIKQGWQTLADKYDVPILQQGLSALANFSFQSQNALAYKTLITQEMLKKGFLASNMFYACSRHSHKHIESYIEALDSVFEQIKSCENGRDVNQLLEVAVCQTSFTRLN